MTLRLDSSNSLTRFPAGRRKILFFITMSLDKMGWVYKAFLIEDVSKEIDPVKESGEQQLKYYKET